MVEIRHGKKVCSVTVALVALRLEFACQCYHFADYEQKVAATPINENYSSQARSNATVLPYSRK